ncbi:hypothetical protein FPANT_11310 [Fusarium pseudoanthophilum]|uniref:Uncharacterized protein n=1 Tax=Fusarium pseudoanthophilum TaxID=48495 RepID=A0A8H5NRL3_9HYPO|nr:hypothetical protein FPANT_11310 [Fusarium pseudoanthophilum]
MPREPPPWRGVRTIIEEKNAKLVLDKDEVISKTVGKLKGDGYFDTYQKPQGEWIVTKVTTRGTHLWVGLDLGPTPGRVAELIKVDKRLPRFLVGYSAVTLEPVFAVSVSVSSMMEDEEYEESEESEEGEEDGGPAAADTFHDLDLECAPGVSVCQTKVIPHHSVLVPGNLIALKVLLYDKDWPKAFSNGDLGAEQAKDLAIESIRSVHVGDSPKVVASVQPAAISLVPNHEAPNLLQYHIPGHPRVPGNRRLWEMLPLAQDSIYQDGLIKGFVYKVPYMSNMRYPTELYEGLASFAREHPYDKLDATAMLFAAQLWVDINEHPSKMKEDSLEENLPTVSLPVFLVYFEHWLKIHENFRCLQFAHPFRVIHKMYATDLHYNDPLFFVTEKGIDSGKVRSWVLDVKARHGFVSVQERVNLFPFMMNGTAMVHPQDLHYILRLTPTQQALIGMPDLRVLGLPSYHLQVSSRRKIGIPKAIANLNFLNNKRECVETELQSDQFLKADGEGPTSLFRESLESGTVWTHEFQLYTLPSGLPAATYIKQDDISAWNHLVNRRLRWLQTLGVMGRVRLHAGDDGLPGYHGMPLESMGRLLSKEEMSDMALRALENPDNQL